MRWARASCAASSCSPRTSRASGSSRTAGRAICYGNGEFIRGRGLQQSELAVVRKSRLLRHDLHGGNGQRRHARLSQGTRGRDQRDPAPSSSRLAIIQTRAAGVKPGHHFGGRERSGRPDAPRVRGRRPQQRHGAHGHNEGFFRVYQGIDPHYVRGDPGSGQTHGPDDQCGDWHIDSSDHAPPGQVLPRLGPRQGWFRHQFNGNLPTDHYAARSPRPIGTSSCRTRVPLLSERRSASRRDRATGTNSPSPRRSPRITRRGARTRPSPTARTSASGSACREQRPGHRGARAIPANTPYSGYLEQDKWLWPLGAGLNPAVHGAIHVNGPIAINGVFRGTVTVYAQTSGVALAKSCTSTMSSTCRTHDVAVRQSPRRDLQREPE